MLGEGGWKQGLSSVEKRLSQAEACQADVCMQTEIAVGFRNTGTFAEQDY